MIKKIRAVIFLVIALAFLTSFLTRNTFDMVFFGFALIFAELTDIERKIGERK